MLPVGQPIEIEAAIGGSDRDRGGAIGIGEVLAIDANALVVAVGILVHGNLPQRALKGEVARRVCSADRKQRQHITATGSQARKRDRLRGSATAAMHEIVGEAAAGIAEVVGIIGDKAGKVACRKFSHHRRVATRNAGEGNSAERE